MCMITQDRAEVLPLVELYLFHLPKRLTVLIGFIKELHCVGSHVPKKILHIVNVCHKVHQMVVSAHVSHRHKGFLVASIPHPNTSVEDRVELDLAFIVVELLETAKQPKEFDGHFFKPSFLPWIDHFSFRYSELQSRLFECHYKSSQEVVLHMCLRDCVEAIREYVFSQLLTYVFQQLVLVFKDCEEGASIV